VSTSVHLQAANASLIGTKLAPSVKLIYGEKKFAYWFLCVSVFTRVRERHVLEPKLY